MKVARLILPCFLPGYALECQADWVLVEGAGGWFTPLSADQTFADWVQIEQLPVILVVGVKLGCINHAMLTAQPFSRPGCAGRLDSQRRGCAGQATSGVSGNAEAGASCAVSWEIPWLADTAGCAETGITSISASCLQRHPVGDKLVVQLVNVALGHVTPAIQHAKALRDPADKRQLLLS